MLVCVCGGGVLVVVKRIMSGGKTNMGVKSQTDHTSYREEKNFKGAISKLASIATIKKSPPFETKFEMLLVGRTYMMHASRPSLGLFCPVKNVWICVCVRTLAFFCNLYGLQLGGRVFMPSAWKYATLCILWTGIIAASLIMVSARAKCISAL